MSDLGSKSYRLAATPAWSKKFATPSRRQRGFSLLTGSTRRTVSAASRKTFLISAPPSSASHYRTTHGLGRVEDILKIKGLTLDDANAAGGLSHCRICSKASRSELLRGTSARPGSTAPSWCA